MARWWGPKGFKTTYCKLDVRPGGKWRICMRSPEGKDDWAQGVYREVVAKLMFRHGVFETVKDRKSHRSGWSQSLDRLAEYVTKG